MKKVKTTDALTLVIQTPLGEMEYEKDEGVAESSKRVNVLHSIQEPVNEEETGEPPRKKAKTTSGPTLVVQTPLAVEEGDKIEERLVVQAPLSMEVNTVNYRIEERLVVQTPLDVEEVNNASDRIEETLVVPILLATEVDNDRIEELVKTANGIIVVKEVNKVGKGVVESPLKGAETLVRGKKEVCER